MNWIVANIKWIMLISGALTCTMLYTAVDLVMVLPFAAYLATVRLASSPAAR